MSTDEVLLPKKLRPSKQAFESVGFMFTESNDNSLYKAYLPEGWHVEESKSHIKKILDQNDRVRVIYCHRNTGSSIISYTELKPRYKISFKEEGETQKIYFGNEEEEIYVAGTASIYDDKKFNDLSNLAKKYANNTYPGWEDPTMYWDSEKREEKGKIKIKFRK